ncbi:VOC family protein [Lacunisphaera limnophila]|nr:VOC family protein [Lacunisphaera limnophila]
MEKPKTGTISWADLTVPDAVGVKDFYAAVAGWGVMPVAMDGYEDFCMMPPGAEMPAAGICHARGPNADLPAQWLVYITVPDLAAALAACQAKGGQIIRDAKEMGGAKMAVIRDPAGAVAALYQPGDGPGC